MEKEIKNILGREGVKKIIVHCSKEEYEEFKANISGSILIIKGEESDFIPEEGKKYVYLDGKQVDFIF